MQLLLISRCPPYPLHLGDRLILYHLARELSQRGHTLDLIAFDDRPDIPDDRAAYAGFFRSITIIPAAPRSQLSYVARLLMATKRFPHRAADSWSSEMWMAIKQHLAANTYDAVQLLGGIQVYEYRHALGALPAVITPYESYSLYLRRMLETAGTGLTSLPARLVLYGQRALARAFEGFMFTPYDRTVVVSDRDSQELHEIDPSLEVTVIPNGVDLSRFSLRNAPREAATLLFTGNYEYAPNVDAALVLATQVLPQIRTQIPEAKLWLVGNAPPPELLALASEHVIVTGRVPDVLPYLQQATVFVCPLRMGAGIKNKLLEALAAGCPVIATPMSIEGIILEHGCDALIAELDSMPTSAIGLLRDPELQQSLSRNGRHLIETDYTWEQVAAQYEAVYQAVHDNRAV